LSARNYTYYDFTQSLCSKCLERVDAKIVFQGDSVFMLKSCLDHGPEKTLIATDVDYYKKIRHYIKPSEIPKKFNTKVEYGCPYDCGLCADHEQHSCVTIVEITDRCNLTCPTCYAGSSPTYGRHRTIDEVTAMLDAVVDSEGEPDIVQLSGGEPTVHPQFFEILAYAKTLPIRHIMINTNGIRIANDDQFVDRLNDNMPGIEIYLQFDSFKPNVLQKLRGKDLSVKRQKALDKLEKYNIHTTLVVTLERGQNDDEIGKIIDFALEYRCIRGVTFQPTQVAGRIENFNPSKNKFTLTETRKAILEQTNIFKENDIVPVPCNPDALSMAYALKLDGKVIPLTSMIDPDVFLNGTRNTILLEQEESIQKELIKVFSTSQTGGALAKNLQTLLCCLPMISAPNLSYENIFRVIILKFMDAHDFDVRAVKKACVSIVSKDLKMIPFETMNLLYRDDNINRLNEIIASKNGIKKPVYI
tara:strand:- start:80 stop:1498 length:1419 start_codon:yes stop_codon:yes gene_type:complete